MLICFGLANAQKAGKRSWIRVILQVLRIPRFNPLTMMGENRAVAGVDLGSMWPYPDMIHDGLETLVRLYEEGRVKPHVDEVFPFERAAEAHAHIETGKNVGKVVLRP
jgi:NADPH:quinone reductase-like Zn-dependent oxidoreductase